MPMTADKLKVFLPSKYLSADGDAIPQQTADAGGSLTTIKDAALVQADDFWNGALGWFSGNTATAALRGLFFHVSDFVAATDTLTLSKELPAIPAAGDTYRLVLGGKWRSSQEAFGMALDGDLPELVTIAGPNITGVTIKKAAGALGEQTLSLHFDFTNQLLYAKVGVEAYGVGLDVSVNQTDAALYTADGLAFVRVDVVAASLPGSDQDDTWELSFAERTLLPDFDGYETRDPKGGKVRYHLEVLRNDGPVDMTSLAVIAGRPDGVTTELAPAQSLGLGAGSFDILDATDWPTNGFWIWNQTKDDARYVDYRSGVTLACFAVDWAKLSFDAGVDEILPGDLVEGATSLAQGYAQEIVLTSGSWAGLDAAGYILLKRIVGTFLDNETLNVAAVPQALANGASVKGLRDFVAVAWAAGDVVMPMSYVDLGKDTPSVLQFEDPATEVEHPSGITFAHAFSGGTPLAIGTLLVGDTVGIWRREWIEYNNQPHDDVNADTVYTWE